MNAIVFVNLDGDALHLVLIRGVDDFFIDTAARKLDRNKSIFACFVHNKIPLSLVSFLVLWSDMKCTVFLCKFIPLFALLLCPSDCEMWFTINWISEKSIVNTCKMFTLRVDFLTASLPRIPSSMVLFLFFGFAMSSTMTAPFLDHVVRERECIQS